MITTVAHIADRIGGQVEGQAAVSITGVASISEARAGQITFVSARKYQPLVETTEASAIIVPIDSPTSRKTLIRVSDPRLAFAKVMRLFYPCVPETAQGIHPSAVVAQSVQMGQGIRIGACACIEDEVVIGDESVIFPGVVIGRASRIGAHTVIYANVTIRERVTIGDNVIIHSGAVVGSDGFGYAQDGDRHVKIPQVGTVIVEDDVEIGANVTIDRGTLDATRIGHGTKIDNLVQVAHNVTIGPNSLLLAQVGIAGSAEIGSGVILAGQVGVTGHIKIGDRSVIAAQSGVSKVVPPGSVMFGYPARPIHRTKRIEACISRLPELFKRFQELEKQLDASGKDGA